MKNNSPFRDLAPVFMVCVLLPTTAGMWWRYYFESSAPQPPTLSGTFQTEHLESDGLDRSFSFYAPSQLASSAPLLVALHGANSSGENLRVFTGYELTCWPIDTGSWSRIPIRFQEAGMTAGFRRIIRPAGKESTTWIS